MSEGFREYRPSKTQTFWLCVLSVVATIVIGFAWGGWVTGGTAGKMADTAATNATAKLATSICVDQFEHDASASANLKKLKATPSYSRDGVITHGGWATMPGAKVPVDGVAEMCAEQLAKLDKIPMSAKATQTAQNQSTATTKVQ